MKTTKILWNPITPRPDAAGHWLLWGRDFGVKHTTIHPDWWNGQDPYGLGKIEAYAYLGEMTIGQGAAAMLKAMKPKPKARKRPPSGAEK